MEEVSIRSQITLAALSDTSLGPSSRAAPILTRGPSCDPAGQAAWRPLSWHSSTSAWCPVHRVKGKQAPSAQAALLFAAFCKMLYNKNRKMKHKEKTVFQLCSSKGLLASALQGLCKISCRGAGIEKLWVSKFMQVLLRQGTILDNCLH